MLVGGGSSCNVSGIGGSGFDKETENVDLALRSVGAPDIDEFVDVEEEALEVVDVVGVGEGDLAVDGLRSCDAIKAFGSRKGESAGTTLRFEDAVKVGHEIDLEPVLSLFERWIRILTIVYDCRLEMS